MASIKELNRYVELTSWIRELSSPPVADIADAEEYRQKLLRNFSLIGELSDSNMEILDTELYPLLYDDSPLSEEHLSLLRAFKDAMLDPYHLETLDTSLLYLLMRRLMTDAGQKDDVAVRIRALDDFVSVTYTIMEMTMRVYPADDAVLRYKKEGLDAAHEILTYLSPKRFAALPDDDTKERVLIHTRYIHAIYQYPIGMQDAEALTADFEAMKRALQIADDPFYREHAPSYDWQYHIFRTLQNISNLTAYHNAAGCPIAMLTEICDYTKQMLTMWETEKHIFSHIASRQTLNLSMYRNAYLAGETDPATYRKELLSLAARPMPEDYSHETNMIKVFTPLEYLLTLDKEALTPEQSKEVASFYRFLTGYVHRMPKLGSLTFLLTDVADVLKHYVRADGGDDFETLVMRLTASLHPLTYIHSLTTADMTKRLIKRLYAQDPSMFADLPGETDEEAVADFAYHAAMLADIGKLLIVETILTYGRDLLDSEYELIRTHPVMGARLLEGSPSCKKYAGVVRAHHRWYDKTRGYPADDVPMSEAEEIIADVIAVCDSMDAATDTVGRSYKIAKTFEGFVAELAEYMGTRYAPYVVELFDDNDFYEETEHALLEARAENYRKTFHVLKQQE